MKGCFIIDNLTERSVVIQQIALNNKMLENGYITKQTHSKAHDILLNTLTNLAKQDMMGAANQINYSDAAKLGVV